MELSVLANLYGMKSLPETLEIEHNRWHRFNDGVCPWMDEETGLWGYVDARGSWVMEPAER